MLSSGHDMVILIRAAVITSTDPYNVGLVFQLYMILPQLHVVSEVLECTGILERIPLIQLSGNYHLCWAGTFWRCSSSIGVIHMPITP